MKLVYLAQAGLYDDWAHTLQIMKMCEAFAENGIEVTLVVPKRSNKKPIDPFVYNQVEQKFKITEVPYLDIFQGTTSKFFYFLRLISFIASARIYLLFKKYDQIYTREVYLVPFFRKIFLEIHAFQGHSSLYRSVVKSANGIVVLTSFLKSKVAGLGIPFDKIIVAPDGVRPADFTAKITQKEARIRLNLPQDSLIFGYLGALRTMGIEKGVGTAIEALKHLEESYVLYIIGGEPEDIKFYKQFAKNKSVSSRVIFAGKIAVKDRSLYLSACDVAVAPFPETEHYKFYMSPLKIFEYMAAKKPIIATDLPSIREVLKDNETALLIPPGNSEALAQAIIRLKTDEHLRETLIQNAFKEVELHYTWKQRAKNIIENIKRQYDMSKV